MASGNYEIVGETLACWYDRARQQARATNIDLQEVDWLLQETLGLDLLTLRLRAFPDRMSSPVSLEILASLWERRLYDRAPIQYLTESTVWRRFHLRVDPGVLIPRPETEQIVELAAAACRESTSLATGVWADLGTGSGAIALGLAERLPQATVLAVERSPAALAVARENIRSCGFGDRIQTYLGSWFEPLAPWQGKLSGIVSNPPYIPTQEIDRLQPEVARHEPHLALDGGKDGLDCLRHLLDRAPHYLRSPGILILEMMVSQAPRVERLLRDRGCYPQIRIARDLAGIERFAIATCNAG